MKVVVLVLVLVLVVFVTAHVRNTGECVIRANVDRVRAFVRRPALGALAWLQIAVKRGALRHVVCRVTATLRSSIHASIHRLGEQAICGGCDRR